MSEVAETTDFSLQTIQQALVEAKLDGWLFYDFRGSDPIARKILGLSPERVGTRRWFYYVPARGEPSKLTHAIEAGVLDTLPGRRLTYLTWESLRTRLREVLRMSCTVAMQYSPRNEVPYLSHVDAGTVEQLRDAGVCVVSSADLVQRFDATLSDAQLDSHRRAAKILRVLIDQVFDKVRQEVVEQGQTSESATLDYMVARLSEEGLLYDHAPIVAVNAHAADPHFEVSPTASSPIRDGDLLLVDVWAREKAAGSIYADITWTVFVGSAVPPEMTEVFEVVRDARDAVVTHAREAFRTGATVRGFELDRVARTLIEGAGYGEYFIHRTGHSIHEEGHGNGANLDDLETHDTRALIPRTLFSVEPGIYLPGRFGIRSEVDVFHSGADAEVTGPPHQVELGALLA
jgi:Xaa-Pro aminopeptidase